MKPLSQRLGTAPYVLLSQWGEQAWTWSLKRKGGPLATRLLYTNSKTYATRLSAVAAAERLRRRLKAKRWPYRTAGTTYMVSKTLKRIYAPSVQRMLNAPSLLHRFL
jgi:hypothetical protein